MMLHIFLCVEKLSPGGCDYCMTSYHVTEQVCAEEEVGVKKKRKKGRDTILHIVQAPPPPPPRPAPAGSSTIPAALTLITTWGDDVTGSLMLPGR